MPCCGIICFINVLNMELSFASWVRPGRCVSIFLFLSGYGLALKYSYLSPANWREKLNFLIKRLVKFYSNYWVVFLVSVLVGVFVFDRSLDTVYGTHVFRRLCLDFCGVLGYKSYNVTWWFNCLIIACYLLFSVFVFCIEQEEIVCSCRCRTSSAAEMC